MTSSDKVNENAPEQQEQKIDSQKSKKTSPNAGMMGANAVLAAAKIRTSVRRIHVEFWFRRLVSLGKQRYCC